MNLLAQLRERIIDELRRARDAVITAWKQPLTWKHPAIGWLLLVFFVIWCIRWTWHIPTVGYAIAVLAVAAAVMSVLHEPGTFARIGWILLLFGFLHVEMKAIDEDKKNATAELTKHFTNVLENQQQNFTHTIAQFTRQESKLTELQSQIRSFESSSETERKHGNEQMAAFYKNQANLKRLELRRALVDAAPKTIAELERQYEQWKAEDTTARHSSPGGRTSLEYIKRKEQLEEQYTSNLKPTLINADTFREQLFNALPEKLQRPYAVNQRVASILHGAVNGQAMRLEDLHMVTGSLNYLVQAVSGLPPADDE